MNKLKFMQKYRFNLCLILAIAGIIVLIIGCILINEADVISNILTAIGTTFLSSSITIYLFKYDILELFENNRLQDYGIISIVNGRNQVFQDELVHARLKVKTWSGLFTRSKHCSIDIIGISMYSFLYPENRLDELMKLSLEGHKVRIVFANPDSKEVEIQSVAEKKYGVLREHILLQRKRLQELLLCYTLDERITINNNLSIYYSDILPKAFIVRSGENMVITPYLLDGPFKEPTLVVEKQNANSYYNRYQHYIDQLISTSKRYQFVLDTNSESAIK